jgi:hypothetical protein
MNTAAVKTYLANCFIQKSVACRLLIQRVNGFLKIVLGIRFHLNTIGCETFDLERLLAGSYIKARSLKNPL